MSRYTGPLGPCECEGCQAERDRLPSVRQCLLDLAWPAAAGAVAVLAGAVIGHAIGR